MLDLCNWCQLKIYLIWIVKKKLTNINAFYKFENSINWLTFTKQRYNKNTDVKTKYLCLFPIKHNLFNDFNKFFLLLLETYLHTW